MLFWFFYDMSHLTIKTQCMWSVPWIKPFVWLIVLSKNKKRVKPMYKQLTFSMNITQTKNA